MTAKKKRSPVPAVEEDTQVVEETNPEPPAETETPKPEEPPAEEEKTECPTCGKLFKNLKRHHCKEVAAPVEDSPEETPTEITEATIVPCPPGSLYVEAVIPPWVREKMPEKIAIHVAIDWGVAPPDAPQVIVEETEEDFIPEDALEVK